MRRENKINHEVVELLKNNPMVVLRDAKTKKALGVSYTEEGLRGIANKNGIYLYCEGRIRDFNKAKQAKKSPEVIVERFIPREFSNSALVTAEILWINKSKLLLNYNG